MKVYLVYEGYIEDGYQQFSLLDVYANRTKASKDVIAYLNDDSLTMNVFTTKTYWQKKIDDRIVVLAKIVEHDVK